MTNCQNGELIRVGRVCEHNNRPSTTEWWPIEANSIVNTYCGKDERDEHSDQRYWQFGSDILNEIATTGQPSSWSFENLGYTAITCYRQSQRNNTISSRTTSLRDGQRRAEHSKNFQARSSARHPGEPANSTRIDAAPIDNTAKESHMRPSRESQASKARADWFSNLLLGKRHDPSPPIDYTYAAAAYPHSIGRRSIQDYPQVALKTRSYQAARKEEAFPSSSKNEEAFQASKNEKAYRTSEREEAFRTQTRQKERISQ